MYIYIYIYFHVYIYICIYCIYVLYMYTIYVYISMSVCLHLSLRPKFWMDAPGFEREGGGGYRFEMKNHLQPGGPETSSASCIQSPGNTLPKQIQLQLAS